MIVHRFRTLPSTNDTAAALARDGAPAGTVVMAEEQTAGRGLRGRSWYSAGGLGLYVSIVLRPAAETLPLLPLAAGLAARDAIERTAGLSPGLKWPNDLFWEGRKLGGILCRSVFAAGGFEFAVAGIGINVGHGRNDFPSNLRGLAVSLRMATGRTVDREALLEAVVSSMERWNQILARGEAGAVADGFSAHSIFKPGDALVVDTGAERFSARYAGIAPDGSLRVIGPQGFRALPAAEIERLSVG